MYSAFDHICYPSQYNLLHKHPIKPFHFRVCKNIKRISQINYIINHNGSATDFYPTNPAIKHPFGLDCLISFGVVNEIWGLKKEPYAWIINVYMYISTWFFVDQYVSFQNHQSHLFKHRHRKLKAYITFLLKLHYKISLGKFVRYSRIKILLLNTISIQCGAVITRYNMSGHCTLYCNHNRKTPNSFWTHKRHLIPGPHGRDMGFLLWELWIILTAL